MSEDRILDSDLRWSKPVLTHEATLRLQWERMRLKGLPVPEGRGTREPQPRPWPSAA
jgi:hypothetical protein